MTPLRSGPVSGPPITGDWSRSRLELELDPRDRGRWAGLSSEHRSWLGPDDAGEELLATAGTGPGEVSEGQWQPAAESTDRLGQPSGSDGWRVGTARGSLSRTVNTISGAVRIGYRIAWEVPWRHEVVLPLQTSSTATEQHGGPGQLIEVSGWAHAWVLDGDDALGLHWTTDQRPDLGLIGLRTEPLDGGRLVAPTIGGPEALVPPRRDFSWRLVLTAWRR